MAKRALLSLLLVASQCLIDIVAFTPLLIPRGHHGSTASSTETAFQRLRSNPSARHGLVSVEMLAARPKIAFVQTGGTIDKDYPRSTLGYAFEIADPAVERIIADASHVPLGIDLDFHTICRKVGCVFHASELTLRTRLPRTLTASENHFRTAPRSRARIGGR
jgi:hypothetical protein